MMHRIRFLHTAGAGLTALATCIALPVTGEAAEAQTKFWAATSATAVEFGTFPTISVQLQKWRKKSTLVGPRT